MRLLEGLWLSGSYNYELGCFISGYFYQTIGIGKGLWITIYRSPCAELSVGCVLGNVPLQSVGKLITVIKC